MDRTSPTLLDLSITVEENPDNQTLRAFAGLGGGDVMGVADLYPTWLILRDGREQVVGGLRAKTFGRWFLVTHLGLEAAYWRMGLDAKLLGDAERIAREHCCTDIYLDTSRVRSSKSFAQLGFKEPGSDENNPLGLGLLWRRKTLSLSPANDLASLAENGVGG